MTHVYVGSLPDDAESHHHRTTEIAEEDAVLETAKGRHTGTPAEKAKAPGRITPQHTQKQGYDAKSSGGRAQTRVQAADTTRGDAHVGRAGWGTSLSEDKGSSGTQTLRNSCCRQSLSIPGDNEPTRETLSMMNVDKDREARRSITECTPMTHVYVGSLPDDADRRWHALEL